MKKQHPRPDRPLPLKWEFGPDIPTYDYIEDHHIEDMWGLQEAVGNFIHKMETGDFLSWEAVVAHEQGLPLTEKQEAALRTCSSSGSPKFSNSPNAASCFSVRGKPCSWATTADRKSVV